MRRALVVTIICIFIISLVYGTLVLLTPDSDGTQHLLDIEEVVWDGGIWNGQYYLQIINPTDRIIEASVYVFIEDTYEEWSFIKCSNIFAAQEHVHEYTPIIITFFPNTTTQVYTYSKYYLYAETVNVVAVSGDHYILDETATVEKWIEAEVIEVVRGEMVNRSHEHPEAQWVNFTILYHGEYSKEESASVNPMFMLEGYYYPSYSVLDTRGLTPQIGTNKRVMMGMSGISDYRLRVDDKRIWEGTVPEG